jgi:uncharacterized protein with von Willebrand factor type A (vWA) domain
MDSLEVLVGFATELRAAGVAVDLSRVAAAAEAIAVMPGDQDLYWPLRTTLCGNPADLPVFDAVWQAWRADDAARVDPVEQSAVAPAAPPTVAETAAGQVDEQAGQAGADDHELLAGRDVAELTDAQRAEVAALIALLAPTLRLRPVMRRGPARSGRVDINRTVRLMLRNGGEPSRIILRRRLSRPRRLLFLVDVSGSMTAYHDILLRFAHAAITAGPATTEVFALGTRWTRLTAQMRGLGPDAALRAIAEVDADWDGGTTLGRALQSFLRQWGGRDVTRSATVVIGSDGIEFGDQALLPRQVGRLSRIAHVLIWVNPDEADPAFVALAPALADSLEHVAADRRLSGHSFDSLRQLAEVLAR